VPERQLIKARLPITTQQIDRRFERALAEKHDVVPTAAHMNCIFIEAGFEALGLRKTQIATYRQSTEKKPGRRGSVRLAAGCQERQRKHSATD
jgi:hypothetical protein